MTPRPVVCKDCGQLAGIGKNGEDLRKELIDYEIMKFTCVMCQLVQPYNMVVSMEFIDGGAAYIGQVRRLDDMSNGFEYIQDLVKSDVVSDAKLYIPFIAEYISKLTERMNFGDALLVDIKYLDKFKKGRTWDNKREIYTEEDCKLEPVLLFLLE